MPSEEPIEEPRITSLTLAMLSLQRRPWEQGIALFSLLISRQKTNLIRLAHEAVYNQHPDGRLAIVGGAFDREMTAADPVLAGVGVLAAYEETKNEKYKRAANKLYHFVKNVAPRTDKGVIYHFMNGNAFSGQLWVDSVFMTPLFLAKYGDWEDAMRQVEGHRERLFDQEKGLWRHKWSETEGKFVREEFWGTGNGWVASSLVTLLEMVPKGKEKDGEKLKRWLEETVRGCLRYIREDGLFHDVLDKPDTFVETNLAQMLAFTVYKALSGGHLGTEYTSKAEAMYEAASAMVDEFGFVQGVCGAPHFDRPGTSTEGQAFVIMMEEAYDHFTSRLLVGKH